MQKISFYTKYGKRVLDLTLTVPALLVFSPVIFSLSILIWLTLGPPIFFRQRRPGMNGEIFRISKFRTMNNKYDSKGRLLPDKERLTKFGNFMRSTSLDELPELWDVLRGDMSLVGPRPLLAEYLPYYSAREAQRHLVRPGITGLSQVSGRNYLPWDERLELDVQYVEKMNFFLDVRILFKTIWQVLARKDVAVVPNEIGQKLSTYRQLNTSE